jgi:serine/threonine protein kinase, bacterial
VPVAFGKYQLLKRIAVGGMAEIFLGYVQGAGGFKKPVAIKRLLPQHARDPECVKMFLDEARLLARFEHPNIVQVYDVGQLKTSYFLAMEFVHGVGLDRVLKLSARKNADIPLDYAASITRDVCDVLDYVHNFTLPDGTALNLIHRDISPQNIMISFSGVVKVLDFGIAKKTGSASQTNPSGLKGKAAYMSPEQIAQVQDLDRRTDVFSLGIVLFEMATRRRPFEGLNEIETILSIDKREVPDPRSIDPKLPDEMAEIILRALQKDRDQRYQSAREMHARLDVFLRDRSASVGKQTLAAFMRELVPRKKPTKAAGEPGAPTTPTESGEFSLAALGVAESGAPLASESGEYSVAALAAASGGEAGRDAETLAEEAPSLSAPPSAPSDPAVPADPDAPAEPIASAGPEPALDAPIAALSTPLPPPAPASPALEPAAAAPLRPTPPQISPPPGEALFASLDQPKRSPALAIVLVLLFLGCASAGVYVFRDKLFGGARPATEPADAGAISEPIRPAVSPVAPAEPVPVDAGALAGEEGAEQPAPVGVAPVEPAPLPPDAGTLAGALARPRPGAPVRPKPGPAVGRPAPKPKPFGGVEVEPEIEPEVPTPAPVPEPVAAPAPRPEPSPAPEPAPAPKPEPAPVVAAAEAPTFQPLEVLRKRRIAGGDPEYPAAAREAKLQAIVLVKIFVSPKGEVENYTFLKTHEVFEPAVREAIKSWRFAPHSINGRPVGTYTVYKFVFKLD